MITIIDNAESALQMQMERANEMLKMKFSGRKADHYDLFPLRTCTQHEARSNPNFFNWLYLTERKGG